jgi:hypothetical protein
MKRFLILGVLLVLIGVVHATPAHAQLVGGDPSNNVVCPADLDAAGCLAAGYGGQTSGSGGSGGGYSVRCRAQGGNPATYCYTPTFDRTGKPLSACNRGYVSTGYCVCSGGSMSGSCSFR